MAVRVAILLFNLGIEIGMSVFWVVYPNRLYPTNVITAKKMKKMYEQAKLYKLSWF
jgi:hypothetical protein